MPRRHPPDLAAARFEAARARRERGELRGARTLALAAARVFRTWGGVGHPDHANCQLLLADLDYEQGGYRRSERRCAAVLRTLSRARGVPELARLRVQAHGGRGHALLSLGQYSASAEAFRQGLRLARARLGPADPDTVFLLNGLGMAGKYQGRFAAALRAYQAALDVLHEAPEPDLSALAALHHNLGGLHHAAGRLNEGEVEARRGLDLRERISGPEDPALAADLCALAALLIDQGRATEAEALLRRAISLFERVYGPKHVELGYCHHNLGVALWKQGRPAEARAALLRGRELKERTLGADHPETTRTRQTLETVLETSASTQNGESSPMSTLTAPDPLAALLFPVSPAWFLAEVWGRRPLLIKGGGDKLRQLQLAGFDLRGLVEGARTAREKGTPDFSLFSQRPHFPTDGQPFDINNALEPDQVEAELASGANIACEMFDHPPLARFVAALKVRLGLGGPAGYGASASPRGNGWPLHVDPASVFSIQVQGTKRFYTSALPALDWVRGCIVFSDPQTIHSYLYDPEDWERSLPIRQSPLTQHDLEPGDVLYWPHGTLHTTECLGEHSLNVPITLGNGGALPLLSRVLERALASDSRWRHLPYLNPNTGTPGTLPAEIRAFLAERIVELRALLDTLDVDDPAFNEAWQRAVADVGPGIKAVLQRAAPEIPEAPSSLRGPFRLRSGAPITFAWNPAGPRLSFFHLGQELILTGPAATGLHELLAEEAFTLAQAKRAAKAAGWSELAPTLEVLVAHGILESAAPREIGTAAPGNRRAPPPPRWPQTEATG